MGSFIERFFPAKPEKKTPPWFLILFFQKKYFPGTCFFWDLNGFFFGTDPPLIWDPLGPHTIPPRHSAWGSSDVPSPRWLFCGGYGFHGIKSGSSPGDVQNQEGELFTKQWKHIFLICWQIMAWDNHWILTYSIYVISQFFGGFDSPICLQFHFSIRFLKIHVSSGLKPRGHPSISLVDQSVDLTYVKRDRLATGLLVLERFRKRLGLGIKVFELAFFWDQQRKDKSQISLYRVFLKHLSVNGSL